MRRTTPSRAGPGIDAQLVTIIGLLVVGLYLVGRSAMPNGLSAAAQLHRKVWPTPSPEQTARRLQSPVLEHPNIVFVLADDLGWKDVGYNNGAMVYKTPHIDRLAESGVVFNASYMSPNCAPSRATLMTGLYPPRHQLYTPLGLSTGPVASMRLLTPHASFDDATAPTWSFEPGANTIDPALVSIAEVLPEPYTSIRLGKWQLGPDNQGFDHFTPSGLLGLDGAALSDAAAERSMYGNPQVGDELTKTAIEFMGAHRDRPFFVYLSHWDVHSPIRCTSRREEAYAAILGRMETHGHATPIPWQVSAMYGGMITAVDDSVGIVHESIRRLHLENRTMLVFASDNGGASIHTSNAPLRLGKGTMFEGGIRVPTIFSWPDIIRAGVTTEAPIHGVDFLPTFAEASAGWATASRRNARLALRHRIEHVDGVSLMPLLAVNGAAGDGDGNGKEEGEEEAGLWSRALFWHFPHYLVGKDCTAGFNMFGTSNLLWRGVPSSAVRLGEWKLIYNLESNASMLFNLVDDVGETTELSAKHPARKSRLERLLLDWLRTVGAPIPETNPGFVQCPPKHAGEPSGVDGRAEHQPSPRHHVSADSAIRIEGAGPTAQSEDCGVVELRHCIQQQLARGGVMHR